MTMARAHAHDRDWILIIDDDEELSDVLTALLESEGYLVRTCSSGTRALDLLSHQSFSLVLLDLRLGSETGLEILPGIREIAPNLPVFMITAHGDLESAVEAFTLGVQGYIRKPFGEGDLKAQIARAIESYRLRIEVQALRNLLTEKSPIRRLIRSRDPAMEAVLRKIAVASQVSSSVVITGESGTGKELVARALHESGPRSRKPFVAFNCAAIPENLQESELFGHQRGAFTDAKENKPGLFVRANGGTLFLDEIGDAPLSIQAKLLRALQEREVLPLGASTPVPVDVRVIVATHRPLLEEIAAGRFRQDLYYRLHVIPIHVPPLRERPRDIVYLAHAFAEQMASRMNLVFEGLTGAAEKTLEEHPWPGNVRELQNRIEQALALHGSGTLSSGSLFPERPEVAPGKEEAPELPSFKDAKNSFERGYLRRVLSSARGNIALAARLAEKSRTEVYALLRKHGLNPGDFKGPETGS